MAEGITADLSPELKKIPDWGWGVIAGTAVLGGIWWYRRNENAGAAASTGTVDDATGQDDDSLLAGSTGTDAEGDSGQTDTNSTGITSNALWEAQAVAYLSATGQSPLTVQAALEAYLNGTTLSALDQSIVNLAIAQFGVPPEGISSAITTAPPPTTTTAKVTVPGAPTVSAQSVSSKGVTLSWNAVSGATSYVVERLDSNGGLFAHTVTTTSYSDTLVAGHTYTFYVRAKNSKGIGKASNKVKVTLPKATAAKVTASPATTSQHSVLNGKPANL